MLLFKDVAHLYLGCEVQYEGIINGADLKADKDAHEVDFFYTPTVNKIIGVKKGLLKNIFTTVKGRVKYQIGRKGLQTHYSTDNFKPILRPLSSMTEEEAIYYFDLPKGVFIYRKNKLKHHTEFLYKWVKDLKECNNADGYSYSGVGIGDDGTNINCKPDKFAYLLKQGFDLFGLIESKQAIDKTTLNK